MSPSSRRAWIEIVLFSLVIYQCEVALLAEGVDRNGKNHITYKRLKLVALLAEGVDRNLLRFWAQ